MIYYPLSILLLANISEILVISSPTQLPNFKRLLRNGEQWGIRIEYAEQKKPRGLAEAFIIGKKFIGDDSVCLILGDNIFFGRDLPNQLRKAASLEEGAKIFAYQVRDPGRYGVVEFDETGKVLSLEEKPRKPRSEFAIPGLYFYNTDVVEHAEALRPSERGELEITDLNKIYLKQGTLQVEQLGRGVAWLDAGTPESLIRAANFIQAVEERQWMMISCVEEIAFRMGYIGIDELEALVKEMGENQYQNYLTRMIALERKAERK
jgi:glucose-1-phosphate thymidylyltransferase